MILTRIEAKDVFELYRARNNEGIYKWCRQYDVLHLENHEDWFHRQSKDPSVSMYALREDEHGSALGICGLTDIDYRIRRAEFSLYIVPAKQRRGYGEMALRMLLEKGFNSYNLNMIWGETFDRNPAVITFEKLGFIKEGTRRQFYYRDGEYVDAHLYSISREEWKQSLSA